MAGVQVEVLEKLFTIYQFMWVSQYTYEGGSHSYLLVVLYGWFFFFFFSITCILIGTKEKVDLPTVELSHLFLINLNFKSFHFSVRIFLYLPTSFSTICFDVSFAFHPTSSLIKIILFTLVTFLLPLYCCYA